MRKKLFGEAFRRTRLGELRRFFRRRYPRYEFTPDDAGRDDLYLLLLTHSLGSEPARKMENEIEIWAPWMGAKEAEELLDRINRTPTQLRKLDARELGNRLGLRNSEREALGIRTFKPIDMTDEQLEEQRQAKKRARDERRRRRAGESPRETYLANSL
jgi:hypothetical protein